MTNPVNQTDPHWVDDSLSERADRGDRDLQEAGHPEPRCLDRGRGAVNRERVGTPLPWQGSGRGLRGRDLRERDDSRPRLFHWLRVDPTRLLWPSRCLACDAPGLEGLDLCAACAQALPWNRHACARCAIPLPASVDGAVGPALVCGACLRRETATARAGRRSPLQEVHAAFVYAAPLDRLLPRFKFHRDLAAGALLSQLMAEAFASLPRPDALIPVPLHRARLRHRGYDQALELAKPLARALDLPLCSGLLQRVRATTPQSELTAVARRRNLREAFAVPRETGLPAHAVLIDDVMTTGATVQSAALALMRAGVKRVDAWVCARVP